MQDDLPERPDPGYDGTRFLGWLKRHGRAKSLDTCMKKLREIGLDLDTAAVGWGSDRVCRARCRGEAYIWLVDADWADAWARHYDIEVPHHAQTLRTKEKLR